MKEIERARLGGNQPGRSPRFWRSDYGWFQSPSEPQCPGGSMARKAEVECGTLWVVLRKGENIYRNSDRIETSRCDEPPSPRGAGRHPRSPAPRPTPTTTSKPGSIHTAKIPNVRFTSAYTHTNVQQFCCRFGSPCQCWLVHHFHIRRGDPHPSTGDIRSGGSNPTPNQNNPALAHSLPFRADLFQPDSTSFSP